MDSSVLEAREKRLLFPAFTENTALKLGLVLLQIAESETLPVLIDIRTPTRILFHAALPGTSPLNDRWVERKSNTAFAFGMSSLRVRATLREKGESLGMHGCAEIEHATFGGSVPIRVKGAGIVAMVTVSGLDDADDHALAVRGIERILRTEATRK
jgi:uncharacterized protein (UPF0303 family)